MRHITNITDNELLELVDTNLFRGLTAEEIEAYLRNGGSELIYLKSRDEFTVSVPKTMFVLRGEIALYFNNENGEKVFLNSFSSTGRQVVPVRTHGRLISLTFTAKTQSILFLVGFNSFVSTDSRDILLQNKVQKNAIEMLYNMLDMDVMRSMCLAETLAHDRVMMFLGFVKARIEMKKNHRINKTWSDLAHYLMIDPSTLMRELKKLKEQGIVDYSRGEIIIKDFKAIPTVLKKNPNKTQ